MRKKLSKILKELNLKTSKKLVERLEKQINVENLSENMLKKLVIDNLTIGETYFFRDRKTFEFLKNIMKKKDFWKILSVGCSKGEEVYSLSFLIDDLNLNAKIIGIDINSDRIKEAKNGKYKFWSVRFLTNTEIRKYFNVVGNTFYVKEKYKKYVEFYNKNIMEILNDKFDIIFIRRVLIYIPEQKRMAKKLFELTKENGYVVLGQGEYHPALYDFFIPIDVPYILKKTKKIKEKYVPKISEKELDFEDEIHLVENYIENEEYEKAYRIIKGLSKKIPLSYMVFKYKTFLEIKLNKINDAKKSYKVAVLLNQNNDDEIWQLKYLLKE
ncbi:chemotaxis protein CheR [Thermosipho affectus]|uniref:Chemotaxis protein CheR n=1 Tax=Thermosipho affectus TaxID=660294 RepID=A0ABX3IGJ5_9BACT|nr:CheR family methyltransferase [Thermosipho affectus]ONN26943.1 chemotaxis protein CheR [Thermosipho affectus]